MAALVICNWTTESIAQFVLNPTAAQPAAAPFEPTPTPSSVNRKLKQYNALVADQAWNEAIDLLEQLQTEQGNEWIEITAGSNRFQILSEACQTQLASLPAKGLEVYRQRVDGSAKKLFEEGIQKLDPISLNRVVKEYFVSSYGDNALLALGEIAFSKGDMVAARRAWLRIDHRLWGPYGEPIELALYDIDPKADQAMLAQIWLDAPRPDDLLSYPDTDIRLSELLARLIMTSIYEKQLVRSKAELRLLKAIEPEATGWLAGREQPLVSYLERLLEPSNKVEQKKERLSSRLKGIQTWQWPQSLPYVSKQTPQPNQQTLQRVIRLNAQGQRFQFFQPMNQAVAVNNPTHHPVVSNDIIAISTLEGLKGWSLSDGKKVDATLLAQQRLLQPTVNSPQTNPQRLVINGRVIINNSRSLRVSNRMNVPWKGTLTADEKIFYFACQSNGNSRTITQRRFRNLPTRLIGVNPDQEGKIVLELSATEASNTIQYHFAGPPTIRGEQLFVVLSNVSARRELAVACYSIPQNSLAWVTPIGSCEGGLSPQQYVALKVLVNRDTAYLATDHGAVLALDANSGEVRWLTRYLRKLIDAFQPNQDLTPCDPILSGDRLYVGPRDSSYALAFNTGNGRIVWSGEPTDSQSKLLAVTAKTVLFAGEQVEGLDPTTGQRRYLYPESRYAGLRGKGTGLLAGDEYYWPTRNEIQILDVDTGMPTRPPIDLMSVGSEGAILLRAGDRLVVAGPTHMNVLGEQPPTSSEPIPQLSRLMERRQPTGGPLLSNKTSPNTSKTITP